MVTDRKPYKGPSLSEFLSGQYQISSTAVSSQGKVIESVNQDVDSLKSTDNSHMASTLDESNNTSFLDSRDDPFAPRDDKTLTWQNVNMKLVSLDFNLLK
jgi:hypothetical protein